MLYQGTNLYTRFRYNGVPLYLDYANALSADLLHSNIRILIFVFTSFYSIVAFGKVSERGRGVGGPVSFKRLRDEKGRDL